MLVMEVCRLLGLSECSKSTPEDDIMLRILTPLVKLYTAKQVSKSLTVYFYYVVFYAVIMMCSFLMLLSISMFLGNSCTSGIGIRTVAVGALGPDAPQ